MKTIKLNGKFEKISIDEERALRIIQENDYAIPRSALFFGGRRHGRYLIPTWAPLGTKHGRLALLGIRASERRNYQFEAWLAEHSPILQAYLERETKSPEGRREAKFFEAHPRCRHGMFGNPRRVNLILRKLDQS
jgi:hypothetical protein